VRDAYYHPVVDSSEEPFKWGLPDLDGLREFLHNELGWQQLKVDELLLPIIQRMNKRGQVAALNRQGNLNDFLDISAGSGTHAPRKNRAYESKRLQQVISDFRKKKRQDNSSNAPVSASQSGSQDESEDVQEETSIKRQRTSSTTGESAIKKKGRTTTTASSASRGKRKPGTSSAVARGRGRGRGRTGQTRAQARKSKAHESSSELSEENMGDGDSDDIFVPAATGEANQPKPRPRPRPTYKGARDPVVEVAGGEASESALNVGNSGPDVLPEAGIED